MSMRPTTRIAGLLAGGLACVCFSLLAFAQEPTVTDSGTMTQETADKAFPSKPPYSPYVGRNFPTRPLFGDTHLHTAMSFDAGMFGARLGPVTAHPPGAGSGWRVGVRHAWSVS